MSQATPSTRVVFFTMVRHPIRGRIRVGKAYRSRKDAADWLPFVRGSWRGWRGCSVSISRCTLRFEGGVLSEASRRVLDEKYNMDLPVAAVEGKLAPFSMKNLIKEKWKNERHRSQRHLGSDDRVSAVLA